MSKNTQIIAKSTSDIDKNTSDIDKNTLDISISISISISIRKKSMIYHGSPYEMQTEMQGERQRMSKRNGRGGRRPPPPFLFCWAHPLPGVPLTFVSAFHTEIHGKSLLIFLMLMLILMLMLMQRWLGFGRLPPFTFTPVYVSLTLGREWVEF